ncbi:MAG TPA: hypothetical protein VNL72_02760 [Gammaproteobacteria bacterium]|nr:hypothetical protein [Gammaproteobacteria bacterium]
MTFDTQSPGIVASARRPAWRIALAVLALVVALAQVVLLAHQSEHPYTARDVPCDTCLVAKHFHALPAAAMPLAGPVRPAADPARPVADHFVSAPFITRFIRGPPSVPSIV